MESKPLISVIMATYNEPPIFIEQAIRSILSQTYSNFELIILDDSTRKETKSAIDNLSSSDDRIILIRKDNRMGFVPALNEGLRIAKGDFIARMDGDDVSLPDRFMSQIKHLNSHPEVDILGGAVNIMDENGKKMSTRFYPIRGWKLKIYSIFRSPFSHPTVIIRRKKIGNFYYDESFNKAEDIELWLRLRNQGAVFDNLQKAILNFRAISDMSNKRNHSQFKALFKARIKNFSFKHILKDIPAVVIALIYSIVPLSFIKIVYNIENK